MPSFTIDRAHTAERIERDVETLAEPDYTLSSEAIQRYAYTDAYRNTLEYFTREPRSGRPRVRPRLPL